MRRLLLEVATSQVCAKVKSEVIGLPSGDGRIAGRWFIQECADYGDGRSVSLALGGPGWIWVDETLKGVRVHQYVYFFARVSQGGALEVSFDESARILSAWMTPAGTPTIAFSPLSSVNYQPQNPIAKLLGMDMPSNVDGAMSSKAEELAGQRFKEITSRGTSITYKTPTAQLDVLVGRVANGPVPRPFPTAQWIVNERQELHPGGFHIAGPFPYSQHASLEALIESGFDLQYAPVCADAARAAMAQLAAGQPASPSKAIPTTYVAPGQKYLARLNLPLCDWALVTYSRSDTVAAVEVIP
jgi:hypothetical protein